MAYRYDYGYSERFPAHVSVAQRRRKAEAEVARLRKMGSSISPVKIEGKKIATTFWGMSWCSNLENYRDYESRLPRGRSYVLNGLVIDLQIAARKISALVSGSEIYRVAIDIEPVAKPQWAEICRHCAGGIDSLVELLQGRLSQGIMERLCRQDAGLFPRLDEIRFSCNCPDGASMCKHIAAVLYGVGARLDSAPELLFRLRDVSADELLAQVDSAVPLSSSGPAGDKVLQGNDVAALFGLEMDEAVPPSGPVATAAKATRRKVPQQSRVRAASAGGGLATASKAPARKMMRSPGKDTSATGSRKKVAASRTRKPVAAAPPAARGRTRTRKPDSQT